MKRIYQITGIFLLLVLLFFTYKRFYPINELPKFQYSKLDNSVYDNSNLDDVENNLVFIYFSCKCNDCKTLINDIEFYKKMSGKFYFVLVTTEKDTAIIKNFVDYKSLESINIPLLIDYKNNFPSDFGLGVSIDLPKIIIFDRNKKLIKEIDTFEKIENL